ncbi:hypothetical protein [Litoribacterium kuwaitense]|nr:hypothetical protein [Litoribacterium kuwaitense]
MMFTGFGMTAFEAFLYIRRAIFSTVGVQQDTYALFENQMLEKI